MDASAESAEALEEQLAVRARTEGMKLASEGHVLAYPTAARTNSGFQKLSP